MTRGACCRAVACVALVACGPKPPASAQIDAYLNGLSAKGELRGAVLVARHGVVLSAAGYGVADEASSAANTPSTDFRIGSNTKQFTAMATLLLQDRGALRVGDSICLYIDDCPAAWQAVTLQHLLDHSSGIPDYTGFDNFPSVIGSAVSVSDLIARFKPLPLLFPPGSQWSYSNSGYVLLGAVVEKVSGQTYADFLQQNLLVPIGLASTGYDTNDPPSPAHATGYLSPGTKPVFLDMSEFYSAGALFSHVTDLHVWDEALMAGRIGSAAALEAMWSPHIPCPVGGCALATDVGYGDGWFIAEQSGTRYVYHWGRIDGFRSSNGFYPDAGVVVVVLSNLETTDVWGISTTLGELALTQP
jgi:CubicO group peptidase (beta-lactamase class C family)